MTLSSPTQSPVPGWANYHEKYHQRHSDKWFWTFFTKEVILTQIYNLVTTGVHGDGQVQQQTPTGEKRPHILKNNYTPVSLQSVWLIVRVVGKQYQEPRVLFK
jgi:hypothetical protein